MKPYTAADIEADLRAAIDADDEAEITRLGALLDHQPTKATPSLHSAALYYASVGLRVFPLGPGSKYPFPKCEECKETKCPGPERCGHTTCHGLLDGTTDTDAVNQWWAATPNANVGIATGHLVDVVDIDGPVGVRSYLEIADDLPPIYGKVSTPRPGGSHLYIAADSERSNKAQLFPGIDFRALGGYALVPPSVVTVPPHPGDYYWRTPLDLDALHRDVAA